MSQAEQRFPALGFSVVPAASVLLPVLDREDLPNPCGLCRDRPAAKRGWKGWFCQRMEQEKGFGMQEETAGGRAGMGERCRSAVPAAPAPWSPVRGQQMEKDREGRHWLAARRGGREVIQSWQAPLPWEGAAPERWAGGEGSAGGKGRLPAPLIEYFPCCFSFPPRLGCRELQGMGWGIPASPSSCTWFEKPHAMRFLSPPPHRTNDKLS